MFLTSTQIKGKFVIRLAVLAFRTKMVTIDKAIAALEEAKEKVLAEL